MAQHYRKLCKQLSSFPWSTPHLFVFKLGVEPGNKAVCSRVRVSHTLMTSCDYLICPQVTQNSNPERLISWLLDHTHLEVPELESPPTPVPDPPRAEAPPQAADVDVGSADSSSESSDYLEEVEEEEEEPSEAGRRSQWEG